MFKFLKSLFGSEPERPPIPEFLSVRLEGGSKILDIVQLDQEEGILRSPYRMTRKIANAEELPVRLVHYDRRSGAVVSSLELKARVGSTVDVHGKPGDRCFFWG